jgi:plastocyanin
MPDTLPHTVTADDGLSFDSGNLDAQQTFSIIAGSPGTFTYHSLYHPWMTVSVIVTP